MKKITEDTNIIEALETDPKVGEILFEAGLGCIGCSAAQFETIGQGLAAHGFDQKEIKKVIKRLNE